MTVQAHDLEHMEAAIKIAEHARREGERPFGCVITDDGNVVIGVGRGSEKWDDPTHHSELVAIRMACHARGELLQGCTIYSTHEPCAMCVGAINHSKVSRVVWGSSRAMLPTLFRKRHVGAATGLRDTTHPPELVPGVLAAQCVALFNDEVRAKEHGR